MKSYLKHIFYPLACLLFSLFLVFILFVSGFELACYGNPSYYRQEFQKYQVQEALLENRGESIPLADLEKVMGETLRYLRGDRENLIIPVSVNGVEQNFYQEDEASHMADVRVLFTLSLTLRMMFFLSLLAIVFLLVILEHGRALAILGKGFLYCMAGFLAILLLFFLYASQNFDQAFTQFHLLFFSQGNWSFDPALSRMINIMPEEFFQDTAFRILRFFLLLLLPFLPLAWFFKKRGRNWGYPSKRGTVTIEETSSDAV